jgi:hypothetical protein
MKKSLVIATLGLTIPAASSFGQGSIGFNSYLANDSAGIPIFFSGAMSGPVGVGYTADLLYSLFPITDPANPYGFPLLPGWSVSGSGAPSLYNVATPFETGSLAGYFQSPNNFVLDPYTPGTTVYFEVIVYQTAAGSYANSIFRAHSASFSDTLTTGPDLPSPVSFAPFTVFVEPEPATLTLLGLGGLTALLALRRKQV